MQNLRYVGKNLFLERVSIQNFLKKNKTPFYIYSENQIVSNYLNFVKTFKKTNPLICFAAKSNSNTNILRILGKLGAGADVVSGGELLKALKAGIKPKKIVFSGVGKTEEELKSLGVDYKTGQFPMRALGRARASMHTDGFVKILADATSDKVLGVHIIGPHAGEMIAEMAIAMEFGASSEDIARTCHAHPTFSEAIKEAALSVEKRQIHS